jgi:outer membrane protein TolC
VKKVWPLAILTVFLFVTYTKAEEVSLSLDEALVIALRDNRDILLKAGDLKKAKVKIAESHADLFPALTFTGNWTHTRGYYSKDISQTSSQIDLKQNLYTGGKTFNTIKYNGYKFEVTKALLDKVKIETALNVKKGLFTLLLAQDFTKLNKLMFDNGKEQLRFIKERYKAGEVSESEVLRAESSLNDLSQVYESSLNQVSLAQAVLINLLYLDKDVNIKAVGEFNYESREIAFDEGLLKALEERPEIRQHTAQLKADKSSIEIAKSDTRPNIYASWDYYSRSHAVTTTVNTRNWNDYNILGVTFSWPIFDGWRTKAKVEQAVIDLRQTQLLKEKAIKDIILELKDAYLGLKDAIAMIKSSQSDYKVYYDNYQSVSEKYKRGELSFLDKSNAEIKYEVSRFNQNQAAYDYTIAKANFEKATGQEAVVWLPIAKATGGI